MSHKWLYINANCSFWNTLMNAYIYTLCANFCFALGAITFTKYSNLLGHLWVNKFKAVVLGEFSNITHLQQEYSIPSDWVGSYVASSPLKLWLYSLAAKAVSVSHSVASKNLQLWKIHPAVGFFCVHLQFLPQIEYKEPRKAHKNWFWTSFDNACSISLPTPTWRTVPVHVKQSSDQTVKLKRFILGNMLIRPMLWPSLRILLIFKLYASGRYLRSTTLKPIYTRNFSSKKNRDCTS